jgi:chromosome segregation ATPase
MSDHDPSREDLLVALQSRVRELEECHRQILALRLEASVRAAYVIDLQNQLQLALDRAQQYEAEATELRAKAAFAAVSDVGTLAAERAALQESIAQTLARAASLRGAPLSAPE